MSSSQSVLRRLLPNSKVWREGYTGCVLTPVVLVVVVKESAREAQTTNSSNTAIFSLRSLLVSARQEVAVSKNPRPRG